MKHFFKLLAITIFFSFQSHAQTWTSHNAGTVSQIADLSFPTNDTGYVVTAAGQVRKTVDGAITWNPVSIPTSSIFSIFFISGQFGFSARDSMIYKTTNGGASWTPVMNDNQVSFGAMFFPNPLTGYASAMNLAGDSAVLYKTSNGGTNWTKMCTKDAFFPDQALFFINSTTGFWSENFDIYSTANGGTSFTNVLNDISQSNDIGNIDFPNADTGYAVDIFGSLLRSEDAGTSWSAVTFPGAATYDVYFFDGQKGFACGGNGTNSGWVQQTSNAGASWSPSYTSSYSFYCMSFPSDTVGYVGGDNGTVLKFSGVPTGIVDNQNQQFLSIYPNPTTESVTISNVIPGSKISLLNLSGQIIKEETIENSTMKMNLENVATGIYLIEMENAGVKTVQKLVVE